MIPTIGQKHSKMSLAEQFLRFASVGTLGTGVHYLVLIAIVGVGQSPVFASACGFVAGALTNYALNRRFTFISTASHREAASKFFLIAGCGLAINTLLMGLAINTLGWHYLAAQLFATASVLLWNFAGNRYWTFKERSNGNC